MECFVIIKWVLCLNGDNIRPDSGIDTPLSFKE